MNIEFTNKAFAQQEGNPIIKKNLEGLKFKDRVRAIMNKALFEADSYLENVSLHSLINLASRDPF